MCQVILGRAVKGARKWPTYTYTMASIYLYYGQHIPILWPTYTHTMANIHLYYGQHIPILWPTSARFSSFPTVFLAIRCLQCRGLRPLIACFPAINVDNFVFQPAI